MTQAESFKRATDLTGYDAIVIGSGIGGLTTASLLARTAGMRVLVLERHYEPGGFTHTFKRPGFEWDVGVHYVGGVHPNAMIGRVFDFLSDGKLTWEDMGEVYDRVVVGQDVYDLPKGRRALVTALKSYFPHDHDAIDAYMEAVQHAVQASGAYFVSKVLPPAVVDATGMTRRFFEFSDKTTGEVLDELTQNPRLKSVLLAQWGDYGLPPSRSSFAMHAMVVAHYFHGGFYPVGGSSQIYDTFSPAIFRAGGRVLVRAEVQEILVEGGRAVGVRMSDGREIRSPVVISGAGFRTTFSRLMSRPEDDLPAPAAAHMCLYIGVNGTDFGLDRANRWIYPDDSLEENIGAFWKNPDEKMPVVYLSFPSQKDPDFPNRHPGRTTIEAITIAPFTWFGAWANTEWKKRGADYEKFKEAFAERLLEAVYQQHPSLRGHVVHAELSTPLSTRHFCNYAFGEIYGLEHTPARFRDTRLRPATDVPGLFLTGQDVSTCGVAGALFGGVLAAAAIVSRDPGRVMRHWLQECMP